jgi:2-C-methyl-D-erythritol 2,4-cyclodiphosphate synthase
MNSEYRVGIGFDSHPLVDGRDLFLGGIKIDYPKGLLGHSDGDVVIHSLIDAFLGACSLPDIGEMFPPADNKYKDVSSLILLKDAYSIVEKNNYIIVNADITVIANEPEISIFKEQMKKVLIQSMNIEEDGINIKGKTPEGLAGLSDAIASIAVVLLRKKGR